MGMARIPVAELWVQTQGPGLVRATATAPARSSMPAAGGDLREWVRDSKVSSGALVTTGLVVAALGGIGAMIVTSSVLGIVAVTSMITAGTGLAFLGALKRKDRNAQPKALPPASASTVLMERARRIQSVLDTGDHTFEQLLGKLRWTETALLEALVVMKDSGQVVEDLDLDSGEWVYRSIGGYGSYGSPGAMSLADRQAREQ
jgi:hypothetical protein